MLYALFIGPMEFILRSHNAGFISVDSSLIPVAIAVRL
jgi:hypothetical protein